MEKFLDLSKMKNIIWEYINNTRNYEQTSADIKTEIGSKRKLIVENADFISN